MKVRVIDLYTDRQTGDTHIPGEELIIADAKRVKELIAASVIEAIDGEADPDPVPEEAPKKEEKAPAKAPAKKATTAKKRVKKDE